MDNKLRNEIIRLAHAKPELREDLLPLLKKAYVKVTDKWRRAKNGKHFAVVYITQAIGDSYLQREFSNHIKLFLKYAETAEGDAVKFVTYLTWGEPKDGSFMPRTPDHENDALAYRLEKNLDKGSGLEMSEKEFEALLARGEAGILKMVDMALGKPLKSMIDKANKEKVFWSSKGIDIFRIYSVEIYK